MHFIEPEGPPDHDEFLDEPVEAPEARVGRMVGSAAAELVVPYDRPFVGQPFEGSKVAARAPGSAVQEQQRRGRAGTDDAVPDLAAGNVYIALLFARAMGRGAPGQSQRDDDRGKNGQSFGHAAVKSLAWKHAHENTLLPGRRRHG